MSKITPETRLSKLSYITGISAFRIFEIAARRYDHRKSIVWKDFKRYVKEQHIPRYVAEFLETGSQYIDGAPWTWLPKDTVGEITGLEEEWRN